MLCADCTQEPIDGAIICPALGVIAKTRCRHIKRMPERDQFEHLYGWERRANHRTVIFLRSDYFARGKWGGYPTRAYADGTIRIRRTKPSRGASRLARLTAGGRAQGVGARDAKGRWQASNASPVTVVSQERA